MTIKNIIPKSWLIYKFKVSYIYCFIKFYLYQSHLVDYNLCILINKYYIKDILFFFKNHSNLKFKGLVDIVVNDNPEYSSRFTIQYILKSRWLGNTISVVSHIGELLYTSSVTGLFSAASWFENEIWEFFGIYFFSKESGFKHRRLLTDYGFRGYPLRKDFPLSGFFETTYISASSTFEVSLQGKALFLESNQANIINNKVNTY